MILYHYLCLFTDVGEEYGVCLPCVDSHFVFPDRIAKPAHIHIVLFLHYLHLFLVDPCCHLHTFSVHVYDLFNHFILPVCGAEQSAKTGGFPGLAE